MLIEPRDPLIVRDGRPFTNSPGARAKSLPFPLPQTLAGATAPAAPCWRAFLSPRGRRRSSGGASGGPFSPRRGKGGGGSWRPGLWTP